MTNDTQERRRKEDKGEKEGGKLHQLSIGNDPLGRMYVFFLFLPFIISVMMRTHEELFSPISLPSPSFTTLTERRNAKRTKEPHNKCKSE